MAYQTGTVANLNDLLDTFATFLGANGWTIVGNWREPMLVSIGAFGGPPPEPVYNWRWARRLHVEKGSLHISMQDFWGTKDIEYGNNGTLNNGPGISASISASIAAQPADSGLDPSAYDAIGPAQFPTYTQAGAPGSVNGIIRTVIMPLPSVTGQPTGSWRASTHLMAPTGDPLAAPFGIPLGAADPARYWMFADASGDNVVLCVLRADDLSYIPLVSYLYFGKVIKGGVWTGGEFLGASHGNNGGVVTTDVHRANRWGPPGAMVDGFGIHTLLHIEVDAFVGANRYAGLSTNQDNNIWTGKKFSSTSLLVPKASDPSPGVFGVEPNGVHLGTARLRRSAVYDGAPMWPTYWMIKRDNGLYSTLGVLPNIFQTNSQGFAPGEEYPAKDGTVYVIFDGFAVKKVP